MFKKLFYIVLVVLVLFSFVSCSYAADVDNSSLSSVVGSDLNSSDFSDNVSVVSNDSKVVSKFVANDGIFHEGDREYDFCQWI